LPPYLTGFVEILSNPLGGGGGIIFVCRGGGGAHKQLIIY